MFYPPANGEGFNLGTITEDFKSDFVQCFVLDLSLAVHKSLIILLEDNDRHKSARDVVDCCAKNNPEQSSAVLV